MDGEDRGARLRRGSLLLVAVAATAIGSTAWASHRFSDVPDDHPFHDEIEAVTDAGIAEGFEDGTYRPSDPVTRQAMAAFLERGGTRVAEAAEQLGPISSEASIEATIESGAIGDGRGWLLAIGTVSVTSSTWGLETCPCVYEIGLSDTTGPGVLDGPTARGDYADYVDGTTFAAEAGTADTATVTGVFAAPAGEREITLSYESLEPVSEPPVDIDLHLVLLYVPFGSAQPAPSTTVPGSFPTSSPTIP